MNEGWGGAGTAAPAAPGWYTDPWGQAPQRYWDGASWTPQTVPGGGKAQRPRLPEGTPVQGIGIWLLAVLPILGAITPWLYRVDTSSIADYLRAVEDASESGSSAYVPPPDVSGFLGAGYGLVSLVGLVLTVVLVVLAYQDAKHLARVGVVRPFHWAWSILSPIVYVIGRSVVVRKVGGVGAFAPMWTAIVVMVVAQVSALIWMAALVGSILDQAATALG